MKTFAIASFFLFFVLSFGNDDQVISPEKEKDFNEFLSNFSAGDLPYTIDENTFHKLTRKPLSKEVSHKHMDFIPYKRPMYSRMGPDDYTYEQELALSDNYRAVIIGGKRSFEEKPNYYHLVTYTPKGKVIAYEKVAWTYGKRETARCSISPEGEITIEHCTNHLDKRGDIASTDVDEVETFIVGESGSIVRKERELKPIKLEVGQQEQSTRASLD